MLGDNNTTKIVRITNRVVEIEDGAFSGLTSLKEIRVDSDNQYYASYGGCLYNKDYTVLICIPQNTKSVQVKKTITSYTPHALDGLAQSRIDALNQFLGNTGSNTNTENTTNNSRNTTVNTTAPVQSVKPSNNTSTDFSQYVYTDRQGRKCFKYTGKGDTRIIVPDGVEKIAGFTASTLEWNDTITYVYIPTSVRTMSMYALFDDDGDDNWYNCLYQCRNLQTVECGYTDEFVFRSNGNSVYQPGNIYVWSSNSRIPYDEDAYRNATW
jgi:hypothetical protein